MTVECPIRISVIIPCRNECEFIIPFLKDLASQQGIDGHMEILVADGQSDDGTRMLLEKYAAKNKQIRIIDNPSVITPAGLNRAIKIATGDIVLRMDVHTRYAPDYISKCINTLEQTGADNVGGPARTHATGYRQRSIAAAYSSRFTVGNAQFHFADYEGPVDTVTYGCWHRETLLKLGGFDENLIRNQDDELNLRIINSGGTIWQSPEIRSWYTPRRNLGDLFRQYHQYGFWKMAIIRKHGRPASLRHLVPGGFLLFLLATFSLGLWIPQILNVAIMALVTYSLFLLVGSITIARKAGWDLLVLLPITISTFHFAYGSGFLRGWLHWRGNRNPATMTRLSR